MALPDLLDANDGEYCTRMAFKVTPTYSSKLKARLKWQAVIKHAQQHLSLDFSHSQLSPQKLQALATLIDKTFLNGSFAKTCKPKYVVQERLSGECAVHAVCCAMAAVAHAILWWAHVCPLFSHTKCLARWQDSVSSIVLQETPSSSLPHTSLAQMTAQWPLLTVGLQFFCKVLCCIT
jgi:hypothetical protein